MRAELLLDHSQFSIFNLLASRAIEAYLPPTQLPPTQLPTTQLPPTQLPTTQLPTTQLPRGSRGDDREQGAGRRVQGAGCRERVGAQSGPAAYLDTCRFGIRLEV